MTQISPLQTWVLWGFILKCLQVLTALECFGCLGWALSPAFRLPNVTKSSIKPYHLPQCSDFMALILVLVWYLISEERCALGSDYADACGPSCLGNWALIAVAHSRCLCNRNTFLPMQWLFSLMLDFVFRMIRKFAWVWFVFYGQQSCFLGFGLIFFKETRIS